MVALGGTTDPNSPRVQQPMGFIKHVIAGLVTLALPTAGVIWYGGQVSERVDRIQEDITDIKRAIPELVTKRETDQRRRDIDERLKMLERELRYYRPGPTTP